MKKITRKGATVDAAIKAALQELNVTRTDVEVEIMDAGKKGFLGFGARDAEVAVTLKETSKPSEKRESAKEEPASTVESTIPAQPSLPPSVEESVVEAVELAMQTIESEGESPAMSDEQAINETKAYVTEIAKAMGIDDLVVKHEMNGKYLSFQLDSEKAAFLIGKRGQTLNALQQLAQLVANKSSEQFKVVRLDVGDYRERREQSLEQFAERMADQAVRNGRKVQLEPMPSYERKVIHNALSNRLDIETYSEGTDPNRYLVIEPII
ncbi:protein jag [Sporosarcina luteola]|uniref:RNA-binding cell elongation regulator Jag/EloR n=1 Tax=Sporosarcina luteola TaxID=582850 RepID=UPI0020419DCB|nr:RNA-binding cell elongation regulator Jag/EloR [Sporosarcina luteola]MCM3744550.1 protein jag [Sporosarcina luteola]